MRAWRDGGDEGGNAPARFELRLLTATVPINCRDSPSLQTRESGRRADISLPPQTMDAQRFRDEQRALRESVGRARRAADDRMQDDEPSERVAPLPADGPPPDGPQLPLDGPLVSVVVVCWNAAGVLGRCLEQLLAQDYAKREIIVVDDGSEDATLELARAAAARAVPGELSVVASSRNRGCPSARNLGLRHARGEIVAFIDADGFATASWLSELVRAFGAEPAICGLASTVFYDDNPMVLNGAGGTVNRQGWAADLSMNESFEVARLAGEALYPMGCGMAVRREAIERVGPFDDRMLNYYDDVDYGIRLWRAGYEVHVAADAWIDHGAIAGDSARKRLLCERHRMRVVLKHEPIATLSRWAAGEARELLAAAAPVRAQKLRAIAWNALHLASVLASRWRMRRAAAVPERLRDASWGDAFPAGVPERSTPVPERASAGLKLGEQDAAGPLLHGWFPAERSGERGYRWAGVHAALLVSLSRPAACLRLDYAHVPEDAGGVDLAIRRGGSPEPLAPAWSTRLRWQFIARSLENHPIDLPPGDYEVVFSAVQGWLEPPLNTRLLGFALAEIELGERLEIEAGGLEMSAPSAERQLVEGWFEREQAADHAYRWSSARAAAIVRLVDRASEMRLRYRMTPGRSGDVEVSVAPVRSSHPLASWQIGWREGAWREESFAATFEPGDYIVRFETTATWSNRGHANAALPPENRALGLALASIDFD
jgi:GT2 family glycosyltransferase